LDEGHICQRWAALFAVYPTPIGICLVVAKGNIRQRRVAVLDTIHPTAFLDRCVTAEGDVCQRRGGIVKDGHPAAIGCRIVGKAHVH